MGSLSRVLSGRLTCGDSLFKSCCCVEDGLRLPPPDELLNVLSPSSPRPRSPLISLTQQPLNWSFQSTLPPFNPFSALPLEWSLPSANLVFFHSSLETCSGRPLLTEKCPHPSLTEPVLPWPLLPPRGGELSWLSCFSGLQPHKGFCPFPECVIMFLPASVHLHILSP